MDPPCEFAAWKLANEHHSARMVDKYLNNARHTWRVSSTISLTSIIEDEAGLDCAGEEIISDTFNARVTFFLSFPTLNGS